MTTPARTFHRMTWLGPDGPPRATLRVPPRPPGPREPVPRPPSSRTFGAASADVDATVRAVATRAMVRDGDGRKAYPSAGALYAVRCFALLAHARTVAAVGGAVPVPLGSYRPESLRTATFHQVTGEPSWLLLTGEQGAYESRYGLRGYRYLLLEAGHAAQCLLEEAGRAGLATLPVGAFDDEAVADALGLDGTAHVPLYLLATGTPVTTPGGG